MSSLFEPNRNNTLFSIISNLIRNNANPFYFSLRCIGFCNCSCFFFFCLFSAQTVYKSFDDNRHYCYYCRFERSLNNGLRNAEQNKRGSAKKNLRLFQNEIGREICHYTRNIGRTPKKKTAK